MLSLVTGLQTSSKRLLCQVPGSKRSASANIHSTGNNSASYTSLTRGSRQSTRRWTAIAPKGSRIANRTVSSSSGSSYEAPTAEKNDVGKPVEEVSHIPWWDKIGVDTALEYKTMHNWRHPAMSDEEIETLVDQMPTDLELAGLTFEERNEYLRARYEVLQQKIAKERSERRKSPHTFEPVLYEASWSPTMHYSHTTSVPTDASASGYDEQELLELQKLDSMEEYEMEELPPHPYGPIVPPPVLPDVSYWKARNTLKIMGVMDQYMLSSLERQEEWIKAKERRLEYEMPWLSKNESVRVSGEQILRKSPDSRSLVEKSIKEARSLRQLKNALVEGRNTRRRVALAAQGGHERLAWHQITAREWNEMSDVEFAYWRHRIYADWMKENGCKGHEPNSAGTVTLALRRALKDWQDALYQYEEARRPAHMTTNDRSIWHYELTQTEWYKAGSALEKRLTDVERRALLHRRRTVLTYLNHSFADWNSYYNQVMENARVVEKWGAQAIEKSVPEKSERSRLNLKWRDNMTVLMQALQSQKEIGPFPFDVPVEKLDQHVIDKIYAYLMIEEEAVSRRVEERIISSAHDLPPAPEEMKIFLTNPVAMLASSGEDAESGLFGPKLAASRRKAVQEGALKTTNEMDRRRDLMLKYWSDHGITEVDMDGNKIGVSERISYEVVERVYFELLDSGIDVHGLYEPRQWEVDEAGRYKASKLSPIEIVQTSESAPAVVSLEALESSNARAFALLDELMSLAFPNTALADTSSNQSKIDSDNFDITSFLNETVPVTEAQVERSGRAPWLTSTLGLRPRNVQKLRWLAARGSPEVVRAEREAAFFSLELGNGESDPHPHLWEALLGQVWKMRRPPSWLISRCPLQYQDWYGVTDEEVLHQTPSPSTQSTQHSSSHAWSAASSSPPTPKTSKPSAQEITLNKTSHLPQDPTDPRRIALLNPRRQAWELSKRVREYKSLLLGADLTESQERTLARLRSFAADLRTLVEGTGATPSDETSDASKRKYVSNTALQKFQKLRRDIITQEEINAASWMLEFDFEHFFNTHASLPMRTLLSVEQLEGLKARFQDGFMANAKGFAEPTRVMKLFDALLNSLLRSTCKPQDVLDMETDLFRRRQTIEKRHTEGLSEEGLAVMLHHYTAIALKKKLQLVMDSRAVDPTLGDWTARFITPKKASPVPKTFVAAITQFALLPFSLFRFWSSRRLPYHAEKQVYGGPSEEKSRASVLVTMVKHLEAINASQPWRMWTVEPWTWRSAFQSQSSGNASNTSPVSSIATSSAENERYQRNMEIPRKTFWEHQSALWEDYIDQQLSYFHDLMIQQRAREGIPVNIEDAPTDGTHASKLYWLGESYLAKKKITDAIECFDTAARHGSPEALFALGRIYSDKIYESIKFAIPQGQHLVQPALELKSRHFLEKAANLGHPEACFQLVLQCRDPPKGAPADTGLMVSTLRTAIERFQSPAATNFLANFYSQGSLPEKRMAVELYRRIGTPEATKQANELNAIITQAQQTQAPILKDI